MKSNEAPARTAPGHRDRKARGAVKALARALSAIPGLPSGAQDLVDAAARAAAELED